MNIKAGNYISKATVWGLSETKSGAEQFAIEFPITDDAGETHTLTWFGGFSNDKAEEISLKAMRACGWTGNDLSKVEGLTNDVQLVVANEEYPIGSGDWRTKIKWINAIGGAIKHLDAGKAASFADRMKARVAAFDASHGGAPKPAARPPVRQQQQQQREREPGEDDMGF